MSSSDLLRTKDATTNYQAIEERASSPRSCSPISTTANDLARRLRSALTPPRTRRAKLSDETRPRSATASPGLTTSAELVGGMPPRHKTVSCGDIGRLENIFEPRLAPYTPPLKVRRGLDGGDRSPSLRGLSDEEIEELEFKLFEPRDVACTPPLRRRRPKKGDKRLSPQSSLSSNEEDLPDSTADKVTQLQRVLVELRASAKASSHDAAMQLSGSARSTPDKVTVRELDRLQHSGSSSPRPQQRAEVACC